jgi:hypothetical protein
LAVSVWKRWWQLMHRNSASWSLPTRQKGMPCVGGRATRPSASWRPEKGVFSKAPPKHLLLTMVVRTTSLDAATGSQACVQCSALSALVYCQCPWVTQCPPCCPSGSTASRPRAPNRRALRSSTHIVSPGRAPVPAFQLRPLGTVEALGPDYRAVREVPPASSRVRGYSRRQPRPWFLCQFWTLGRDAPLWGGKFTLSSGMAAGEDLPILIASAVQGARAELRAPSEIFTRPSVNQQHYGQV